MTASPSKNVIVIYAEKWACRQCCAHDGEKIMATTSRSKSGARLGTQFRGKLAAAYGQRGTGPNSLWYVYSPRSQRDWVLRSDLEWDHFVLAESDPTIASCSYEPSQQSLPSNGKLLDIPVDAIITYADGGVEWRRVRFASTPEEAVLPDGHYEQCVDAAKQVGVTYKLWTEETIRKNGVLLANWRRAIAWMAAARDRSLAAYQTDLQRAIQSESKLTLAQIETMFGEAMFALYVATAFRELQRGVYISDLDALPLSLQTVIELQ